MRSQQALAVGKTLAISWLPVAERARSTIIARRALHGIKVFLSYHEVQYIPFCRFTHTLHNAIKSILAPFFQGLCDGLGALFIGGEFKKSFQ